jgi:outer membrane lipoprotein-sorting protein
MRRRNLISALFALGPVASVPAAGWAATQNLTPNEKARVESVNGYLSSLQSVRARFNQSDPQGGLSSGALWLKRPGKARFQYDPPADLLVVSDGYNVMVNDRRLKTFDQYPLGMTPLGLLLARQVRLDKGVVISAVSEMPGGFSITARDGKKAADGSITLLFTDKPLTLTGWVVVDGQGQRTQIALGPLELAADADPMLFVLHDPRPRSGRP